MIKYYFKYFYRGLILILSLLILFYYINNFKYFLILTLLMLLLVTNYTKIRSLLTFKEIEELSLLKAMKKVDISLNDHSELEILEKIKSNLMDFGYKFNKEQDLMNQLIYKNNITRKYLPVLDSMYQHEHEIIYFEKINHTDINRVKSSIVRLINKSQMDRLLYKYNSSQVHVVNINIIFYVVISNNVTKQFKEDIKKTYHVIDNTIAIPILIDLSKNTVTYYQLNKFFKFYFATYNKEGRYWAYRRTTIRNYNHLIKALIK